MPKAHSRVPVAALAVTGVAAALVLAPSADGVSSRHATAARVPQPPVGMLVSGLDNPRQISFTRDGRVVIAQAGHGSYHKANCAGPPKNQTCVGLTGKVTVYAHGKTHDVMTGLLSGAGPDGSFAVGSDGASKRLGGTFKAIITYAPPDAFPQGIPGKRQAGKLLARRGQTKHAVVANIARFEARHDPDGEGVDSNPYSTLALRGQTLVADAAGDYIASVRHGRVRLWATLPEYGKRVDAVPTVVSLGGDGHVYVGELHSEQPGAAKVWEYDRHGNVLGSWGHFTTVSGVARTRDGTLYVSELFAGCGSDPNCTPGRVVRVSPNGDRTSLKVPFPAGVAARGGRVLVAAFSTAPAKGLGGDPTASGQLWRLTFPS